MVDKRGSMRPVHLKVLLLIFLLAGQVAPVSLLPGVLQGVAVYLPFRYMIGFPVEILTGNLTRGDLLLGFLLQAGWLFLTVGLFGLVDPLDSRVRSVARGSIYASF